MKISDKKTVLSSIRATGKLHLGNYLGAMRYFVELSQDESKKCFFFIANLHTLTTKIDPDDIKLHTGFAGGIIKLTGFTL